MNLRLTTLLLVLGFLIASCSSKSEEELLVEKTVLAKIEKDGEGLLQNVEIQSLEKKDKSIYVGVHSFLNPMFDAQVRVTNEYTFSSDFKTVIESKSIKTEKKTDKGWVDLGF